MLPLRGAVVALACETAGHFPLPHLGPGESPLQHKMATQPCGLGFAPAPSCCASQNSTGEETVEVSISFY